jgi:transposase
MGGWFPSESPAGLRRNGRLISVGIRSLVKALGLSWQKTRPRHPKADKAAQERFKKGASPAR